MWKLSNCPFCLTPHMREAHVWIVWRRPQNLVSLVFWWEGVPSSPLMLLESWSFLLIDRVLFDFSSSVRCSATPAKTVSWWVPSFFIFFASLMSDVILSLILSELKLKIRKLLGGFISKPSWIASSSMVLPSNLGISITKGNSKMYTVIFFYWIEVYVDE